MSTTIFTAREYDPARDRRRRNRIIAIIVAVIVIAATLYAFRDYPEERVVSNFFTALKNQNYEQAYGIWMADPNWKQHPQEHRLYPFTEFHQDWGPGGEYGPIHDFRIDGAANPKHGSGVVVVVTVNGRADKARIWVEKSNKSLTFSPY
jgi:hypothetical protein